MPQSRACGTLWFANFCRLSLIRRSSNFGDEPILVVSHSVGNFYWSFGEFKSVIKASEVRNAMVSIIRIAVSIIYFEP